MGVFTFNERCLSASYKPYIYEEADNEYQFQFDKSDNGNNNSWGIK